MDFDYRATATYFTQALISDPANPVFLENAIIAQIALGEAERAAPLARQMDALGEKSQAANMAILAALASDGEFEKALSELGAGRSLGPMVDGLLRAWFLIGTGEMTDALAAFDKVSGEEGLLAFGLYQKALALASVGDFEGAEAIFSGEAGKAIVATRRGIVARIEVLSQLERGAEALDLIETSWGETPDPGMAAIRDKLMAGETLPFTMLTGPADGVAEVFFTLAGAFGGEDPDPYALAYARLAAWLRPDHVDAILLAAGMLEKQEQFDLAGETYNLIPRDDPAFHAAEIGRAEVLIKAGKTDAAIEVLEQLGKAVPQITTVWTTLGDTYRREERFAEAVKAYDRAIATFESENPVQWATYFARGIAHERVKDWPKAEADFRMALKLNPDQPQVLNYLGYSFVEMQTNYDEALEMIRTAVKAEPDAGYIVDSLGWALYRLGRYDEAVVHMERAVELMPVDPVVNDHLGDVLWAVGRKREAEFQWKRALSFEPETEEEAARIRRKIEVGLDEVLKEEGAPPLAVSENDD
jgi:tetratricopeptide (TPR) repeat protein